MLNPTTPQETQPPTEAVAVPPAVEAPITEKPPEEDRSMVEKVKPMSPKARDNFARLEENLKQQEAARQAAEAKLQEYESKYKTDTESKDSRLKELEEKLALANPDDFTAKEKKYQQELNDLRGELKLVALERDPEFIARYDAPRTHLQNVLQDIAVSSGVTPEDFQRALRLGQEDRLEEIRENLQPSDKRKYDAALLQIEQVNMQRDMALKDKETTYNQINQQRQQQYQQVNQERTQNQIAMARKLAQEPFEKIDGLPSELKAEVEQTLVALAGGEGSDKYNVETIMREFAASVVQRRILQGQHQAIEAKDTKIQELEAKLKEREEFIQKQYGSMPNNEVNGTARTEAKKPGPLWERVTEQVNGKSNEFI
jgi:hypothetical protein